MPSDRNDPKFASNCCRRDALAGKFLESEVPVEALPHVETNQCTCGVSLLCNFLIKSSAYNLEHLQGSFLLTVFFKNFVSDKYSNYSNYLLT